MLCTNLWTGENVKFWEWEGLYAISISLDTPIRYQKQQTNQSSTTTEQQSWLEYRLDLDFLLHVSLN